MARSVKRGAWRDGDRRRGSKKPSESTNTSEAEVRFVARALTTENETGASDLTDKDAPTPEAWSWYLACKASAKTRDEFWRQFSQFLKAKNAKVTDEPEEKADDQRTQFRLFDVIYREAPALLKAKQDYDSHRQALPQISVIPEKVGANPEQPQGFRAADTGKVAAVASCAVPSIDSDIAVEVVDA